MKLQVRYVDRHMLEIVERIDSVVLLQTEVDRRKIDRIHHSVYRVTSLNKETYFEATLGHVMSCPYS